MPYTKHDIKGSILGEFVAATRFKNDFRRYWPQTTVNGVQVYADLYSYIDGQGVIHDAQHDFLYKLLGIKYEDLNQDYSGIQATWFEMSKYKAKPTVIDFSTTDLYNLYTPFPEGTSTFRITYHTDSLSKNISNQSANVIPKTNSELLEEFQAARLSPTTFASKIKYTIDPMLTKFVPLLDFTGTLFTTSFKVISTSGQVNKSVLGQNVPVYIEVTITKVPDVPVGDIPIEYADSMSTYLQAINNNVSSTALIGSLFGKIVSQVFGDSTLHKESLLAYNTFNPLTEDNLIIDRGNGKTYLKVAGMADLKPQDFMDIIGKAIRTEYSLKDTEWWEDLIVITYVVITIFLTVVFGPIALAISSLVGQLLAMVAAQHGHYALAAKMGRMATYIGYAALAFGMYNFMAEAAKVGVTEAIKAGINEAVASATAGVGSFLVALLKVTTIGFGYYSKTQAQKDKEDISDKQRQLDELQNMMDMMPTEKQYQLLMWNFESYQFCEVLDAIDAQPYEMTQGFIDRSTSKYFDQKPLNLT